MNKNLLIKNQFEKGKLFSLLTQGSALLTLALFGVLLIFLINHSTEVFFHSGWKIFSFQWNPSQDGYGILPFIYGTLVSSFLALGLALPVCIGASLCLNNFIKPKISSFFVNLFQVLSAIPSIVYGLWGIFVLAPWIQKYLQSPLSEHFSSFPLFSGPPMGLGMMSAAIILAIMILPTMICLCQEAFRETPSLLKEGALALGASRWENIRITVLSYNRSAIFAASALALGRALGETMAVTMLIGNQAQLSPSLFAPAATMASVIANEYTEANSDLHVSALTAVGLVLLLISLGVHFTAKRILKKYALQKAS